MPALTNPRHERFARYFMREGIAARAYLKAGFKPTTRNALDVSACQLLRRPKIKQRIRELQKQMATRNRITVDTLLQDLVEDRALARTLGQPSAAIAATQLSAKLVGLLVDRKESGAPGEFAGLQSADEVLALVASELGADTARALAQALAQQDKADAVLPDVAADVVDDTAREPGDTLN